MGEKKVRAAPTGMALEMDAMKKIAHQLDRLSDATAGQRVLDFVRHALESRKLAVISGAVSSGPQVGQLGLAQQQLYQQAQYNQQPHLKQDSQFGLIE
jgi:hypothetical protein